MKRHKPATRSRRILSGAASAKQRAFALAALLSIGLVSAACTSSGPPCPGGCPAGQVCDVSVRACVDLRPPEGPADVGRYASLAVDSAGKLVVAAYSARYGDLVLGRKRTDGTLEYEYIDGLPDPNDPAFRDDPPGVVPGPDVGLYASLKLDVLDRPHIAYFDRSAGKLKHAVRTGEGWKIQTVPAATGEKAVGRAASLVIGPEGRIAIAFLDENHRAVMLASSADGTAWEVEQVSTCDAPADEGAFGAELGRVVSLVLDQKGRQWVTYHDPWCGGLHLASRSVDGWSTLALDESPEAGTWLSAARDSSGNVAVAYHDRSTGQLKYAVNRGGAMKVVIVDDGSRLDAAGVERQQPAGQHCALAFGHDGLPRILYLDAERLRLIFVVGTSADAFGDPQVLDDRAPIGLFNALALGPDHIQAVSLHLSRDEAGRGLGELLSLALESGSKRLRGAR